MSPTLVCMICPTIFAFAPAYCSLSVLDLRRHNAQANTSNHPYTKGPDKLYSLLSFMSNAVSTDKVPRRTAKYTYGITLQNGKKAMSAAAAYLKLSTSLPSSAPAGTVTPTIAAYTCGIIDASKKLTATLSADNGYPCSMDVLLTSYDTTGAVPEFKVTASWVHTSASGTTLFDEALLIPTLTVSHSAPVYTGSTLSVAVPVINADDALDAAKHVAGRYLVQTPCCCMVLS